MVRRLKEDIREVQGRVPAPDVVRIEIDGLPDDAAGARAFAPARRVPHRARAAVRADTSAGDAGGRRPARRRPSAAAAVLDRGVRAEPRGAPPDGRARERRAAEAARERGLRPQAELLTRSPGPRRRAADWSDEELRRATRRRRSQAVTERRPSERLARRDEAALWRREQELLDADAGDRRALTPPARTRRLCG